MEKKWWHEKDYIGIIPEKVISQDMSLTNTVEMILKDILHYNRNLSSR